MKAMALWLKIALLIVAILVAAVGAVFAIGSALPRDHVATRRVLLKTPAAVVWTRIADEAAAPSWRSNLKAVSRLADRNGHEVWREEDQSGDALVFETIEAREPGLLVREIADPSMFGGQWRIDVTASDGGTLVAITEHGWVQPAVFRFMARFVFGYTGTMDAYLRDLAASFGESAAVE